ncbi:MAG TPA: ATP-binding protein [Pyrinomonadaceae bacterium]|nr:ATP-binding protein [Pyrinomonadaceae bacterium]
MTAPVPNDEAARLRALEECRVLDTGSESAFDDIVRLAAQFCRTPVALISLVDRDRQWFKARVGLELEELPREVAFCAHAICGPGALVIPDAASDPRFVSNPIVHTGPHVRFYAGVPLLTEDGHALGTLCVIDHVPRELTEEQLGALRVLSHHATALLELRRRTVALDEANRELRREAAVREAAERGREELLARERGARSSAEESERHYRFLAEAIPQQVWTATPDGALDYLNRQTLDYFGLSEDKLLGWGWQQVVHPDDLSESLERWRHSLATGETYEVEFRLRRAADGEFRWHLGRALPMRDDAGRIVRWFGTNTDIDDQKRLYRIAQEANRAKDEFLATLSHELRTPLTSIMGWAEMLSLGMLDEAARRHAVEVIEKSARSQAQLIADLLDVSRISAGRLRLDVRPTDLRSVVEAAADVVRPAADARSISLDLKLDPKIGKVSADPDRLQQVVWNLLSNAVKFTPEGGRVSVRTAAAEGHAEITVTDTGAGIRPEFLPHVFDRFRQAESHMTRAHGGLGIGLSIVRHLVELHGGTVRAESEGEGRGATFRVRLPLPKERPAARTTRRRKAAHT